VAQAQPLPTNTATASTPQTIRPAVPIWRRRRCARWVRPRSPMFAPPAEDRRARPQRRV